MRPGAMVNANGLGAVSPNKGLRQDAGLVIVNNSICDLKKKKLYRFLSKMFNNYPNACSDFNWRCSKADIEVA